MSKGQPEVHHANADTDRHIVPNGSDLPEVYDHAYPEAVPECYPEHIDTSAPEVLHPPVRDQKEVVVGTPRERAVCGLRRKTFWIVFAVVLVVIIAVAVGGGVGGALANKKSSDTNDGTSDGSSSTSSSGGGGGGDEPSSSSNTALLPNTRLASLNYTDADGTQHHHVYYQLSTKHIHGSAWNSSSQTWHAFPVTTDADNIANNTPISASLYRHSATRHDFRVYWLTPANAIAGVLANNKPFGPYASSAVGDEGFVAGAGSGLASYGRACEDCLDANVLAWRGADGGLRFAVNSRGWATVGDPAGDVANGSDVVLGAVWEGRATKYLSVYYVADGEGDRGEGNVTRLLWSGGVDWENGGELGAGALPARVDARMPRIAAFESGYNDTAAFAARVVGAAAGGGGGVELAAWDGGADGEWTLSTTETSSRGDDRPGLDSIAAGSSLAANQAGRVYGFVANGSLGEWVWSRADGFTFAGWVNTTAG